jgi:hypothetical protein
VLGSPNALTTGVRILPVEPQGTGPVAQFFGGLEMRLATSLLEKRRAAAIRHARCARNQFAAGAEGVVTIYPALRARVSNGVPQQCAGTSGWGGANGVRITGLTDGELAGIRFEGIQNLFNQSVANPFG